MSEADENDKTNNGKDKVITYELLAKLNECALTHEEIFNNSISYGLFEEEGFKRDTVLYNIAEELVIKLETGYALNLNDSEFIKNIILLFQYGNGDIYEHLFDRLPEFLKIILNYHREEEVPTHFWMQSLKTQLSIATFMEAFNLQVPESKNLEESILKVEPYCIILDAALQQFDFDTGNKMTSNAFTYLVNSKAIFLELKRSQVPYSQNIFAFTQAYPYNYRFLIDATISVDYGCFINGLISLKNMVFGGPSDHFINNVITTIINAGAYTIPFSDWDTPIPQASAFCVIPATKFYTPFTISEIKTAF